MAYGRSKGFKLGGSKSRGPGLKLQSDMKIDKMGTKATKSKAMSQAHKKV